MRWYHTKPALYSRFSKHILCPAAWYCNAHAKFSFGMACYRASCCWLCAMRLCADWFLHAHCITCLEYSSVSVLCHYLILPCFLALSSWGHAFSVDALQRRVREIPAHQDSFIVSLYAFTLGWLYCTAALPKILGGWLNPSTHAVYGWFVQTYHGELQRALFASFFMKYTPLFIWEIADWLTVGFEFFFVLSVVNRRWLQVFCSCAVVFHWLVLNTLNIPSAGFLICYALFFPDVLSWVATHIRSFVAVVYGYTIIVAVVVILCVSAWWASLSYHALLHLPFILLDTHTSFSVYHHLQHEIFLAFAVESLGFMLVIYCAVQWLYKRIISPQKA
jgi:hypothetical protein